MQKPEELETRWLLAARSRLRLELQGLAFAVSRGATPQEYARFLWSRGAAAWMGADSADADSYLLKEAAPHATHGLDQPMVVFYGDGSSSLDGLPRRL